MKKFIEINDGLFFKQVNSKLCMLGIICVLLMLFLYSCSSEEEQVNKLGTSKSKTESAKTKTTDNLEEVLPISVEENLNLFSEQIFTNAESLEVALNKNSYVSFNAQATQMLNSATNENDLKIVFEMAGIANSQEVIDILKNNVAIQQAFIAENPSFYNLTTEQQSQLLNASIGLAKNSYSSHIPIPITELVGPANCGRDFNQNIDDCAEDFGDCAVFAIAGAYAGIVPGLLAAAYCMKTKITCDNRAKRQYKECVYEQVNEGTPPPTGELTIHCTMMAVEDSCWTTDSNGKYVGRVH